MNKMVAMSHTDFSRKLNELGWICLRKKGSHRIYKNDKFNFSITAPYNSKDISAPMAKRLLKEAEFGRQK